MLHNKFEMPLDLAIKPSRILIYFFYFFVLMAMLGIAISFALPVIARLLLFFILIIYSYRLHGKLSHPEITTLHLLKDNSWELSTKNAERQAAELYGECIVIYLLIWLNFRTGSGKIYRLLLLNDSAKQEAMRLLRARLRLM